MSDQSYQEELDMLRVLRAVSHLYGYNQTATQTAIEEIRSGNYEDKNISELMLQRADELADSLEIVSDYVQSY